MPRGRPAKYKTKEELQDKIDEYFKKCDLRKNHIQLLEYV